MDDLPQFHLRRHTEVVAFDDRIEIHQRQHRMVGMMGEQLTLLSQACPIDAMRFEDDDGQVGADGDNHQGDEQTVTARQFCDEEHARQGGMHHPRHHPSHAHEGEILLGDIHPYLMNVPQTGEEKAREAAHEEAWCKSTATTAAAIGG